MGLGTTRFRLVSILTFIAGIIMLIIGITLTLVMSIQKDATYTYVPQTMDLRSYQVTLLDLWNDDLKDSNSTLYREKLASTEDLVGEELGHIRAPAGMGYMTNKNIYRRRKRAAEGDYGIAKIAVTDFRKSDSGNVLAFVSVIYYAIDLPDIPTAEDEVKKLQKSQNFTYVMGKDDSIDFCVTAENQATTAPPTVVTTLATKTPGITTIGNVETTARFTTPELTTTSTIAGVSSTTPKEEPPIPSSSPNPVTATQSSQEPITTTEAAVTSKTGTPSSSPTLPNTPENERSTTTNPRTKPETPTTEPNRLTSISAETTINEGTGSTSESPPSTGTTSEKTTRPGLSSTTVPEANTPTTVSTSSEVQTTANPTTSSYVSSSTEKITIINTLSTSEVWSTSRTTEAHETSGSTNSPSTAPTTPGVTSFSPSIGSTATESSYATSQSSPSPATSRTQAVETTSSESTVSSVTTTTSNPEVVSPSTSEPSTKTSISTSPPSEITSTLGETASTSGITSSLQPVPTTTATPEITTSKGTTETVQTPSEGTTSAATPTTQGPTGSSTSTSSEQHTTFIPTTSMSSSESTVPPITPTQSTEPSVSTSPEQHTTLSSTPSIQSTDTSSFPTETASSPSGELSTTSEKSTTEETTVPPFTSSTETTYGSTSPGTTLEPLACSPGGRHIYQDIIVVYDLSDNQTIAAEFVSDKLLASDRYFVNDYVSALPLAFPQTSLIESIFGLGPTAFRSSLAAFSRDISLQSQVLKIFNSTTMHPVSINDGLAYILDNNIASRPTFPLTVIIVTRSADLANDALTNAESLKKKDIAIVTIGLGDSDFSSLKQLATNDTFAFSITTSDNPDTIVDQITDLMASICAVNGTQPPASTTTIPGTTQPIITSSTLPTTTAMTCTDGPYIQSDVAIAYNMADILTGDLSAKLTTMIGSQFFGDIAYGRNYTSLALAPFPMTDHISIATSQTAYKYVTMPGDFLNTSSQSIYAVFNNFKNELSPDVIQNGLNDAFTRLNTLSTSVTLDNSIILFATGNIGVPEAATMADTLKTKAQIIVVFVGSGDQDGLSNIASDGIPVIQLPSIDDPSQVAAAATTVKNLLIKKSGICASFF